MEEKPPTKKPPRPKVTPKKTTSPKSKAQKDTRKPVVELTDIHRSFPGPTPVLALRGVDLIVRTGDYVSIMGPSGSGKSTLLNVLGLLDAPTIGSYRLAGIETVGMADGERTQLRGQYLGFVFQSFHLLPQRTVLDNVLLGMAYSGIPRGERQDRAEEALEQVGVSHRAGFYPTTLSGGERQRVAVARATATHPAVLLADEPTGNLDEGTSRGVLDIFDELSQQGLTVILVSHDPDVAGRANRQVVMSEGKLSEVTS
ncbi:MAG: ABC transporter ATP-binding protein [Propionibacteriaceae bacterium]|nr:ABC transporter ATP-binding protein [Propionibacteriaceae bacterium]